MSTSPPIANAASWTSDVDSGASDDEEIAVWGQGEEEPDLSTHLLVRTIRASQDYQDAISYIGSKKFGGPKNVEEMKKLLATFLGHSAGEYFSDERMEAFAEVQSTLTVSSRNKKKN
jgi:glutamine amidotransferase-like uncharacterized protein